MQFAMQLRRIARPAPSMERQIGLIRIKGAWRRRCYRVMVN